VSAAVTPITDIPNARVPYLQIVLCMIDSPVIAPRNLSLRNSASRVQLGIRANLWCDAAGSQFAATRRRE